MASTNPATPVQQPPAAPAITSPPNPAALVPQPPPAAPDINPLLLASASSGYVKGLNILLNGEDAAGEVKLPFDLRAAYAADNTVQLTPEALLEGVTVGGDTALHAVATNGDSDNFLSSAITIYSKAEHLLFVQNKMGDTPLHLAARVGNYEMVSCLIDLAKEIVIGVSRPTTMAAVRVKTLLEMENKLKETVLHQAIRIGRNDIVELLMNEDPGLARFPQNGTSPLYLSILLKNEIIARTLYGKSHGILSYSGPNRQNALHVAALRGPDLTTMLLEWNKDLTTERDENGSTPLHFAAALLQPGSVCRRVLEANPAALYQSDRHGLFPIHVAASVGANRTVATFIKKSPSSAGLLDAKGRTFLHVAADEKMIRVVSFVRINRSLSWILNMQDKGGDTALHLAVQTGSLRTVCALLMNLQVELNLTNEKGRTPHDVSRYNIPQGLSHAMSSRAHIRHVLGLVGPRSGASRQDQFYKNNKDRKESENIKEATQNASIGSVLIATVTFGATFALPGGYRADDHNNGGTPTRAGRYAFDAFIMANTLSFICSSIATMGFMYSGTSMVDLVSRRWYLGISVYLMRTSISSLTTAFTLGVYLVLAPVALKTAIAVCVLSSLVVVSTEVEIWMKRFFVIRPLIRRNGKIWTLIWVACAILKRTLFVFWPIIFIFVWSAIARIHR